jgi:hypothetical protein
MKLVEGYKGTAKVRLAAESGEIDGGCWAWESIKPTWAKGLQSGEVRIVLQTTEKSHPDLKNVPLAIQYAKTDEARALLGIANGPYAQGARPFTVPPGLPQDRLQLLQKAFMETLRDPDLLKEAEKSQVDIDPVDGPTVAKMMAGLYELSPALKSKLTTVLIPGGEKKNVTTASGPSSAGARRLRRAPLEFCHGRYPRCLPRRPDPAFYLEGIRSPVGGDCHRLHGGNPAGHRRTGHAGLDAPFYFLSARWRLFLFSSA